MSSIDHVTGPSLPRLLEGLARGPFAIGLFDPADHLVYANAALRQAFDLQPGPQSFSSMIRHCHLVRRGVLVEADDVEAWLAGANAKRRLQPERSFEVDLVDGGWFLAQEVMFDGEWVLLTLSNMTAFKRKEADLRSARDSALLQAETDNLTGLATRGTILRYLEDCVASATERQPVSIALIDIDHFKLLNDSFGHSAGDEVLRGFGRHCLDVVRGADRVGRVGGEEFLVVLPHTDEAGARLALHRARIGWMQKNREMPSHLTCTFSAAIAQLQPGQDGAELYRVADHMLYRAKAAGRDRIAVLSKAYRQSA